MFESRVIDRVTQEKKIFENASPRDAARLGRTLCIRLDKAFVAIL